jgi:hypothetical protein
MKAVKSDRGFEVLEHDGYPVEGKKGPQRLAQQSSAIGDYDDSFDRPGSSFLWIGENHHLNREEVKEFISQLQSWVDSGGFRKTKDEKKSQ